MPSRPLTLPKLLFGPNGTAETAEDAISRETKALVKCILITWIVSIACGELLRAVGTDPD
jgi:hypothetical protein